MNILQVLTITTAAYFVFVAFWILKMEDYLETREENRDQISEVRDEA